MGTVGWEELGWGRTALLKRRRLKGVEGALDGGRGCVVKRGSNHLSSDK